MREKDHTDKLIEDFPNLFKGKNPRCGVSYLPGWDSLIRELCQKLTEMDLPEDFQIEQIKEKFSMMRFYISGVSYKEDGSEDVNPIYQLICEYESKSGETCEECGEYGEPREGSWIKTLCQIHAKGFKSIKGNGMF